MMLPAIARFLNRDGRFGKNSNIPRPVAGVMETLGNAGRTGICREGLSPVKAIRLAILTVLMLWEGDMCQLKRQITTT